MRGDVTVSYAVGRGLRALAVASRRHPVVAAVVAAVVLSGGAVLLVSGLGVYVSVWPVLVLVRRHRARRHVCGSDVATPDDIV